MPLQISVRIEVYNGTVRFLCHSMAFLYRPASATIGAQHRAVKRPGGMIHKGLITQDYFGTLGQHTFSHIVPTYKTMINC